MGIGRMAAFSDGVLAIVITIMVLGLKVPEATNLAALQSLVPVLLLSALAYYILAHAFITLHGRSSALANALGSDLKNKLSVAMYVAAILLAFLSPWIADVLYVAVAAIWFIPDRRIERSLDLQNHL